MRCESRWRDKVLIRADGDARMTVERLRTWYRGHRRRTWLSAVLFAHVLGFVSSFDALMSTRTAPGAVAWIVSLNTFPVVAVPSYWVFGRSRFQGYVIGRRDYASELYGELQDRMALVHPFRVTLPPDDRKVEAIERLAKMPMVVGNEVELLIDGTATFRSILDGARQRAGAVLHRS